MRSDKAEHASKSANGRRRGRFHSAGRLFAVYIQRNNPHWSDFPHGKNIKVTFLCTDNVFIVNFMLDTCRQPCFAAAVTAQ